MSKLRKPSRVCCAGTGSSRTDRHELDCQHGRKSPGHPRPRPRRSANARVPPADLYAASAGRPPPASCCNWTALVAQAWISSSFRATKLEEPRVVVVAWPIDYRRSAEQAEKEVTALDLENADIGTQNL